jgi:hypothetical protein
MAPAKKPPSGEGRLRDAFLAWLAITHQIAQIATLSQLESVVVAITAIDPATLVALSAFVMGTADG